MPQMTILHVAQPLDAGVPRAVTPYVASQVGRGWSVTVACPPDSELHRLGQAAGARYLPWAATRSPGPRVPDEVRRLAAVVKAVDPDLVHLHSSKAGMAGRLAIRGRRATVFQPHAWSFEAVRGVVARGAIAWERWATRWTDVVVCVSRDERLRGEATGVRARWAVVPNGVDVVRTTPASESDQVAARNALGLPIAPLVIVVGRLTRQKGHDVMLTAWPEVRRRVPDAQLALIGEGPDRAALERLASDDVRFAGRRDDVPLWIAAADVVAIPSRWEAGLSLVAMEAMARGRTVVAADVAGMREGLAGGCGAIVPVDAAEPLAHSLAERLLDPALARREGAAGRRRVEERYDVRATTARMLEVYEGVVRERRGRTR